MDLRQGDLYDEPLLKPLRIRRIEDHGGAVVIYGTSGELACLDNDTVVNLLERQDQPAPNAPQAPESSTEAHPDPYAVYGRYASLIEAIDRYESYKGLDTSNEGAIDAIDDALDGMLEALVSIVGPLPGVTETDAASSGERPGSDSATPKAEDITD